MRVVNIKELKARLSQYVRDVSGGEVFLVTDRSRVVARLGPPSGDSGASPSEPFARLVAAGTRPPLRVRTPADYSRSGPGSGLTTAAIDALLDEHRTEPR